MFHIFYGSLHMKEIEMIGFVRDGFGRSAPHIPIRSVPPSIALR